MRGPDKSSKASPPRPRPQRAACSRGRSAAKVRSASGSATARFKKSAPIRAAATRAALKGSWHPAELRASGMPVARDKVIVDHAGRLHEGVDDSRAAELEAARLEVLRDGARKLGLGRDVADRLVTVVDRFAVHEAPQMRAEAWAVLHHLEPGAR